MIAIAITMASLTVAVLTVVAALAYAMRDAKDEAKADATKAATLTELDKARVAAITSLTADLKTANERVEALDAENKKLRAAQPVGGSFDRMFPPEAAPGGADAHRGEGVVPGQSAADKADPSGPDGLLKPE